MNTHPMYICDRCHLGHYHPMSYCPRCPGRLHRTDVPHPERLFRKEFNIEEHLKAQGIEYIGEYPRIDGATKLAIAITRAEESGAKAAADLAEAEKSGDVAGVKNHTWRVRYWKALADEYRHSASQQELE